MSIIKEFKEFAVELASGEGREGTHACGTARNDSKAFPLGEPPKEILSSLSDPELVILRKIISLSEILTNISQTYQTHILAYYTWELARDFHNYYANNRIIDTANIPVTHMRLFMISLVGQTLETCLDLLGLSKPERM